MKPTDNPAGSADRGREPLMTELLVLPDGRILVHSLTEPFAELLRTLNPDDEQIRPRAPERPDR